MFEARELDGNGWVIDFGALKPIKDWLVAQFDHTIRIALDDPLLRIFGGLAERDGCLLVVAEHVGAEAFAAEVFTFASEWLSDTGYGDRVRLVSVTVKEHGANAATAFGSQHAIAAE